MHPGVSVNASSFTWCTKTLTLELLVSIEQLRIMEQMVMDNEDNVPRVFWFELTFSRSPMGQSPIQPNPPMEQTHKIYPHSVLLPAKVATKDDQRCPFKIKICSLCKHNMSAENSSDDTTMACLSQKSKPGSSEMKCAN